MNCPHCQQTLPDPAATTCPFCGQPVTADTQAAQYPQDPSAASTVVQSGPVLPQGDPTQPAFAPPPLTPPPAAPAAPAVPTEQPTLTYAQPTAPTPPPAQPPAYPPAPPQPPIPPQPAVQPSQPFQQPQYGQQGYAPLPAQQWTGQPQAQSPRKKSRVGCVVGCLVAVVLLVALAGGGFILLSNQAGGLTIGGATIGGTKTGPSGGTLIYQDALDGSTKDSWTGNANCFFGSGGYHIKGAFICYAPADKAGDAVTTVSVTQLSGPITYPYGLVVRRVGKGNYYEFSIDANGKWLFDKVVNGTPTDIVKLTANPAIKTGLNQANTLSVQAKGSHFVFFINGKQVGTADDTTFSTGETGLVGYDGIEVVFANLSIERLKN